MPKAEHKATSGGAVDLREEFKFDVYGNCVEQSIDSDVDGSGAAVVTKFAIDEVGNAWADLANAGSLTTPELLR